MNILLSNKYYYNMVDCCKHSKSDKKCIRKSDKKTFNLPRKFSKKKCKKPKGFTMRSSCAPYKDCYSKKKKKRTKKRSKKKSGGSKRLIKVYFAGGCFWGIEEKFSKLKGIVNTQVGYMGGKTKNPDYKLVSTGKSGYSETVMVEYDPKIISYLELLKFFFDSHDPFSLDKQGSDFGTQYRSIVFYESSKQKKIYEQFLKEFSKSNDIKPDTIKTKLLKKKKFYLAEDYHQKYNFQKECSSLNTENETVFKKICKNNTELAEKPGSGKYNSIDYLSGELKGIYCCSCCNSELYSSKHIYDSGTGWPAFSQTIKKDSILFNESTSELRCRNCGLHLGHRTFDGPTKTKIHDCINSACLHFVENNNRRSKRNKKREKRTKKRPEKRSEKRTKKLSKNLNKKLTKLGEEWVKSASEDMKKRELDFLKKGGKKSKKPVILPKLRPISYKNKKHRYHIKDSKKKRILAIEEGMRSESKKGKSKRDAAIAKKARFNVLRIYRKNNNYKECKRLTDDMKYISKKYKLGKTKNICLK
jgi:peptide methionine sulfoxide reductase msrA/msrB